MNTKLEAFIYSELFTNSFMNTLISHESSKHNSNFLFKKFLLIHKLQYVFCKSNEEEL